MKVEIGPFPAEDPTLRRAAARMLVDGFREHWPDAWPTLSAAEAEVHEALHADKLSFCARSGDGSLLGWIGAQPQYGGNVWELHPLVVDVRRRGKGIGTSLVQRLEEEVRKRGARTLWLGSDDEASLTNLGGIALFPGVLDKLTRIENLRGHPMGFYTRLGFEVVGVVPDANGPGRPDILMAKQVAETYL